MKFQITKNQNTDKIQITKRINFKQQNPYNKTQNPNKFQSSNIRKFQTKEEEYSIFNLKEQLNGQRSSEMKPR